MFKFDLPKWAMIDVPQPSGAVMRMVHIGGGEFISELPPLGLNCLAPSSEPQLDHLQPVSWDSSIIDGRTQLTSSFIMFDSPGALDALMAARERGDEAAIVLVQRMEQAQRTSEVGDIPTQPASMQ